MKKVIRNDLILETCSQENHKNGCYIRFTDKKTIHSKEYEDVIIDYDANGKMVGIEFYRGLPE